MMNLNKLILLPFMMGLSAAVMADDGDVEIHGHISQAYIKTNVNEYFGNSTDGSTDFRELGLSVRKEFEKGSFSAVLSSRKAGSTDNSQVTIDHLMGTLKLYSNENSSIGVSAGRLKIPFGLFNETRDVADTRPSILLPQSIYFDNARQYLTNADGAQFYRESWDGDNYTKWTLALQTTNGINQPDTEAYFLGINWPGHLSADLAHGIKFYHSRNGGRNQYAVYVADNTINYNPGMGDWLNAGTIKTKVVWLSTHHEFGEFGNYGLTAEAFLPRVEYKGFGPVIPDKVSFPQGAYIQGEYRTKKWEHFLRYDVSYVDRQDKNGTVLAAATGRPAHAFFARDWTIGTRYHITSNLSVSAEYHKVNGTAWLPVVDNPIASNTSQYWNMFLTQISWSF